MKRFLFVLAVIFCFGSQSFAQLILSNIGASAQEIINDFIGPGLNITNPVINCPSNAYANFDNGSNTSITLESGVLLTSGSVANVDTLAVALSSNNNGTNCSDPQLASLDPAATHDCCILEFDVIPECQSITLRFVFGSEEYPEWVGTAFNDAFGFFVSGPDPAGGNYTNINVATLPDNVTIASINNINQNTNSAYYINNSSSTTIVYDGLTTVLTKQISVVPCQPYHFKLAISDVQDGVLNSGVFVDFLQCDGALTATIDTIINESCGLGNGSAQVTAVGGNPPYTYLWAPSGGNGPIASNLSEGTYTVTIDDFNNSCTSPVVKTIVVENFATPFHILSDTICIGESTTLTAVPSVPGGTFLWSPGGETTSTITVTPNDTTVYSCVYNLNGCISNASATVFVWTPPVVVVNNAGICPASITTLTASGADSYVWGGGDVSALSTTSGALVYANPTTTTIYEITGTNTCGNGIAYSTVTVFDPNDIACQCNAIADTSGIYCSSSTIELLGGTEDTTIFTYSWTGPNNFSSNLQSPTIPNCDSTMAGVYMLTITDGICTKTDITTVIVNQTPDVTITPISSKCKGDTIQLIANGATDYTWNSTVPIYQDLGDTISFISPSSGTISYAVTGTVSYTNDGTAVTECSSSDNINVVVNAPPTVTGNDVMNLCSGTTKVLTGSGANFFIWALLDPLPGNTNSYLNATSGSGVIFQGYTTSVDTVIKYVLKGTLDNGCSDMDTVNVNIKKLPTVELGPDTITVCEGTQITLSVTPIASQGGANTFAWTPSSVVNNVAFTPTDSTLYKVIGSTLIGCKNSDSVMVYVNPVSTIFAGNDVNVCENETVTLTGSGANLYVWNNNIQNGVSFTPTLGSTTYTVTDTSDICSGFDSVVVNVYPLPDASFVADQLSGCTPLNVNFTNNEPSSSNCIWTISNGTTLSGCGSVFNTFNQGGCFDVTLTVTTSNGCINSSTQNSIICVNETPMASFDVSSTTVESSDANVTFTNNSVGAVTYFWDFGDGSEISTEVNPEHDYANADFGNHLITLTAITPEGCRDSTTKIVRLSEYLLFFIPNTFTPDGDNFNQQFKPVFSSGYDPYNYSLFIYNRWGQTLFESHDANVGWDGTYGAGSSAMMVSEGIYTWRIVFKSSESDEYKTYSGHISLIR